MSRTRQAVAMLALGLVALTVGFAGASALEGDGEPPTTAVPVAAPQAAPAPPVTPTSPVEPAAPPEAPAPPAPAVAETPEPKPPRGPSAPRRPSRPPAAPSRVPAPVPSRPPPAPVPAPPPPARPTTDALEDPPEPPTGISIPTGAALGGVDAAHRVLARALSSAAPGSVEESDLRRVLSLWKLYLAPDAAPAPEGRRATVARALRANAWWFRDRRSPRTRVLLRDEDGIILTYRPGRSFVVNPVATTGRWRGLNDDVPAPALGDALLEMGVERRAGERRFLAWEYYDVEEDPSAIVPGTSGMAQARVALLLAHAASQTGEVRFSEGSLGALTAFTVDVDRGGVRSMVRVDPAQEPLPWYVERAYPGDDPWKGAALNGFMVTLLNLRGAGALLAGMPGGGVVTATGAALGRHLADRGALTLARHLPDHDSGAWSYYGLLTPGRPWRSYLADLNYHCYHVRLLGQLAEVYPDTLFALTADTWQGYVDAADATCPAR